MVIKDMLGVIYAPHKTFKKIADNPKYLAVAIIILLFIALQSIYYYNCCSKINCEQTLPPVNQLSAFTSSGVASSDDPQIINQWTITHGADITENKQDYINQTFYGANSLQFVLTKGNSLSASLEQFGYTANCSSGGFTSLNMHIKQTSPNVVPNSGTLTLYTANSTSSYFTHDITAELTKNLGSWNNLTIPVGDNALGWQATGSPNWSEVTGLKLSVTYPSSSSDVSILLQGIFFRGQFLTQTNVLGTWMFFWYYSLSICIQATLQWIILAAVAYLLLKVLKVNNIVWKPIIATVGYALMSIVITSVFFVLSSLTLPTISCPYDLPFSFVAYSDAIINSASPSSQVLYEAVTAETATFANLTIVISIFMYVLQIIFITFAVKAVSGCTYVKNIIQTTSYDDTKTIETVNVNTNQELSYVKCFIIAVITVIATMFLLSLLAGLGVF
ncbi:MAG: hypothetical protein FWF66_04335 [Candidatus Bathyarchaeota archaeon]|nr:hypothetical protein [Candidatus Termiticorpusculum sp.]MCL1970667.1 hypothetical protein [Candidatus Termiticorpusculum sp.]